jgi:hypothetical protein
MQAIDTYEDLNIQKQAKLSFDLGEFKQTSIK